MYVKTLEQIEKELEYAEFKYPGQKLTREETIERTISKLNRAYGPTAKECVYCRNCNDVNKWTCSVLAAIAILIRGLEEQMQLSGEEMYDKRNSFFKTAFKQYPKIDIKKCKEYLKLAGR